MSAPIVLVLDSSVWIEILGSRPLAKQCSKSLKSASKIIMPTLVLFEVYKKIAVTLSEDQALAAVATLSQYTVTDLSRDIALAAADISIQNRLGMADSIVLAHAREAGALLITLDNYFNGIQGAQVLRK